MQILLNILSLSSFYLCFALGLAVVFGVMRVINFAHGELYMLGAYSAFITMGALGPVIGPMPAYLASFAAAATLCGALGAAIHIGLVAPLREKPLTIFIATLALSYMLQTVVVEIFGPVGQSLPSPIRGILRIGDGILPWSRIFVIAAISVMTLALWFFLARSDVGRRIRAVAQNPRGALLQGVSVTRTAMLTLVLGSAIAGVSGAIMAPVAGVSPFMGAAALWKAFIIIIVGGIGSIWGAVAAAVLFGTLDTLMTSFGGGRYLALTNAAIMLIVLSLMPAGLFGERD
jgi:branched-chain amino acid transport system permease protein/urea transport system permease protein